MIPPQAASLPTRRWMVAVAAAPSAVVGLVLTVVLVVLVGVVGLLLGLVVTVAAVAWAWSRASADPTPTVLDELAARPADPTAEARLANLIDGLCLAGGVSAPALHVVDIEAPNALVLGLGDGRAHVVVTTGLLGSLERIELEGVLARAVVVIRLGDLESATTGVQVLHGGTGGRPSLVIRPVAGIIAGRLGALDESIDVLLDREAVGLTRYPPGLVGALERLAGASHAVPGATPATSPLWLADPLPPAPSERSSRAPIADRIEALELL